ncbi:hypothetical protein OH76DRAFT_1490629 [Lentinus brumalis]|uniref:Uncharacterized protein n=1 Tax=Lentinus brumalis TaxID=2498619 RepID=A0A371CIE1_9APHY|nr:hypothetical protein OH76DRAFT_1490629 [Polyporus brumalis]
MPPSTQPDREADSAAAAAPSASTSSTVAPSPPTNLSPRRFPDLQHPVNFAIRTCYDMPAFLQLSGRARRRILEGFIRYLVARDWIRSTVHSVSVERVFSRTSPRSVGDVWAGRDSSFYVVRDGMVLRRDTSTPFISMAADDDVNDDDLVPELVDVVDSFALPILDVD